MKIKKDRSQFERVSLIVVFVVSSLLAGFGDDSVDLEVDETLLVSDGSRFVPKAGYPRFSWEVTPQYFMFGDGARVLRPEEVRSIAGRTDFLCIEKSHAYRELGAAELGTKHEVAAFKAIKPEMKILFYFNSAYAWPFTSYNQGITPKKIDRHPELKKFLIVDPETGELAHRRNVYCFDVLNPEFREWWSDTVAKGVSESGADGAFIDQMHGFSWLRRDKSEEVQLAMGEMMGALKEKLGPEKILLANNVTDTIARHVYPVVDAHMFEHYNAKLLSKEKLLQDWKQMLRLAKDGKISVFRIGVEATVENEGSRPEASEMHALAQGRLQFFQACYLIGAQPYSYFQYGWGWTLSSGALEVFPELHKPLGAPKGAYERTEPKGWEFTREFEHAQVWVDTEKQQGKITWSAK